MKKTTFLIVGNHAVTEALKNPNRKIERVFLTEDAQKNLNRENQSLNLLKNINVFYKSRKELDNLCGRDEIDSYSLKLAAEDSLLHLVNLSTDSQNFAKPLKPQLILPFHKKK